MGMFVISDAIASRESLHFFRMAIFCYRAILKKLITTTMTTLRRKVMYRQLSDVELLKKLRENASLFREALPFQSGQSINIHEYLDCLDGQLQSELFPLCIEASQRYLSNEQNIPSIHTQPALEVAHDLITMLTAITTFKPMTESIRSLPEDTQFNVDWFQILFGNTTFHVNSLFERLLERTSAV